MTIHLAETSAFEPLLNRAEARASLQTHFSDLLTLISSLVDYGSYLIPRCMRQSEKELTDLVLVSVLGKQALAMLDGAHILIEHGAIIASTLQLRALFEVSVYIDWMLASDSVARATAYYTWNLRRKRVWMLRALPESKEHADMDADISGLGPLEQTETPTVRAEARRQLEQIDALLAGPAYAAMNARFDELKGARSVDPSWYAVLFSKSLRPTLYTLAKAVHRRAEYRLIYELGSESMHSSRTDVHIRVFDGVVRLRPLRDLSDIGFIAQLLIGEAIHTFAALLERYRPTERQNFTLKYIQEWQSGYLKQRRVNYEYADISITV